tara:strand:+ start:208 stop:675 length:468 start_codon:yes stop_codon:yes gene_type:complete
MRKLLAIAATALMTSATSIGAQAPEEKGIPMHFISADDKCGDGPAKENCITVNSVPETTRHLTITVSTSEYLDGRKALTIETIVSRDAQQLIGEAVYQVAVEKLAEVFKSLQRINEPNDDITILPFDGQMMFPDTFPFLPMDGDEPLNGPNNSDK